MVYGYYFRFLKLTHNKFMSAKLAQIAYGMRKLKFRLNSSKINQVNINITHDEALKLLHNVSPDKGKVAEPINPPINPDLDLSVVIPIYNYADLIGENISSILNQDTQYKYEVILVDDGSTDGAQDIVREFAGKDPRVKAIFQKNQGIAGARNTGVNEANGRYLMFIDCDDVVEPDLVQTLMNAAYEQDADIAMCGHNLVKERDGKIIQAIPNIYPEYNLKKYDKDAKILNYAGLPWCKVYKRELWNNVRFLPGYWYEDTIIHALLFTQCKKFVYVPKVCYQYRWYENNFSHTQENHKNPKCIDRYWMLVHILAQCRILNLDHGVRFYTMLIKHLSAYYYPTISGMDNDVIESMFVLACDLYDEYYDNKTYKLPYVLRKTEKALQTRNLELWKLCSKNQ